MRPPDFVIGEKDDPYLERWYVIPRNRWFNIYLHHFLKGDDDRALHDHPWTFISFILRGGYWEQTETGRKWHAPGSILYRPAEWKHRVIITQPSWSLVVVFRRRRKWGFWVNEKWCWWRNYD